MDIAALGLSVDSSGVRRADADLDRLTGSARRAEGAAGRMGAAFEGAKRQLMAFGAAAAAAFSFAAITRPIIEFGDAMGSVAAISRATGAELQALRDVAKEMGATTEFTAAQAARGLQFLVMAGISAKDAVAALPDALNLATAAALDLGQSADIVSNIMTAFGIAAEDLSAAADVLAAASARSNTNVAQIGEAMKYVGTIAANFHVSLNDATAAIGTLGDAGLQASMAGTGLRRILSSLANPTDDATAAINRMGLSIADLNPKTNRIIDLVDKLAGAGLSAADALQIFGDRGGPAILALVENRGKLAQLTETLQDVGGEAARMAGIMRDDLRGDLQAIVSAAQAIAIEMGDAGATGVMRMFAQAAAGALRAIAANMDTVIAAAQTAGIALLAAFGPTILGAVQALTVALASGMVGALRAVALAAAANPLGAFLLAITTIIAAVWSFRDAISQAIGVDIAGVMERGANLTVGVFVGAFEAVKAVWGTLPSVLGDLAVSAANAVIAAIDGMLNSAIGGINNLINEAKMALLRLGTPVDIPFISPVDLGQIANPNAGAAASAASTAAAAMRDALGRNYFGDSASSTSAASSALAAATAAAAGPGGPGSTTGAAKAAKKTFDDVAKAALEAADRARQAWRDFAGGFVDDLRNGLKSGEGFFQSFANAAVNALDRIAGSLINSGLDAIFRTGTGGGGLGNLFGALGSIFGFGAPGGLFANGAAFHHGAVIPFAAGGVVGSPTMFPMRGGRTGLMGEAGPEAIMPLRRGPGGRLGVEAAGGGQAEVVIRLGDGLKAEMNSEMEGIAVRVVQGGLSEYDRQVAPRTAERIRSDPRRRG